MSTRKAIFRAFFVYLDRAKEEITGLNDLVSSLGDHSVMCPRERRNSAPFFVYLDRAKEEITGPNDLVSSLGDHT